MTTSPASAALQASGTCWFVGAAFGHRDDQTDRFIAEGIWEHGLESSRLLAQVRSMGVGDRIAIKAAFTRKRDLPFETWGNTVSVMVIKATGVILDNPGDGRRIRVQWQPVSPAREWYFYTYQPTVWKVVPGNWKSDALIAFTFNNQAQDIARFRNDPFWRERFATDPADLKSFRWTRFYQAIADGLLAYRHDRSPLISFLQQLQPQVESLALLAGDQFADGSTGFIRDIDPFTVFGLFNRGIRDKTRQTIAEELARFLQVSESVPESFEGVPVLNNQNSWFFSYAKRREEGHIDQLWQVFEAGLQLADEGDEETQEQFSRAFDAAMALRLVRWNLTFGLYWCRPWSFLSLDGRSRSYISEKLRLPIGCSGPKKVCSAADYLQLMEVLRQRFEEPDFSAHSFPDLSLEAWTYEGSDTLAAEADEADLDEDSPLVDPPTEEPVRSYAPYSIDSIVQAGSFLPRDEIERILRRWRDKRNLILQGPPGTGKTWLARRLGQALIGYAVQEPQLRVVQFHPNLSYEDFVRGWRPSGNGGLSLHDGVFMQMVNAALQSPTQTYVLVIEEINRGNPAQIFGELLTLLEADKRTPREAMQLCYPDPDGHHRPVHIPTNLYVIGTMNIADRSLALVDMAFRRRFAFIDLEPTLGANWRTWVVDEKQMDPAAATEIEQRLNQLNQTIAADRRLGMAFRIGHSFVTPTDSLRGRSTRDWFAEVVASEIRPLLQEYWFDAPEEAERAAAALLEGW